MSYWKKVKQILARQNVKKGAVNEIDKALKEKADLKSEVSKLTEKDKGN